MTNDDVETYWIDPIPVAASTAWGTMYSAYGQEMTRPEKCFPVVRKSLYKKLLDENEKLQRQLFIKNMRRDGES